MNNNSIYYSAWLWKIFICMFQTKFEILFKIIKFDKVVSYHRNSFVHQSRREKRRMKKYLFTEKCPQKQAIRPPWKGDTIIWSINLSGTSLSNKQWQPFSSQSVSQRSSPYPRLPECLWRSGPEVLIFSNKLNIIIAVTLRA